MRNQYKPEQNEAARHGEATAEAWTLAYWDETPAEQEKHARRESFALARRYRERDRARRTASGR